MENRILETYFGTYHIGESIGFSVTTSYGDKTTRKGVVVRLKTIQGKQFITMKTANGEYFDIAPGYVDKIYIGSEADKIVDDEIFKNPAVEAPEDGHVDDDIFKLPRYNRI